ncbi:oxygen-regulated protein 1 [Gastrophryne carolinensis]
MSESTSTNISMAQTNSTESNQAFSARHSRMTDPGSTKRIYFYKSGDPQFNGIKMVVTNRSFKTFDALLDSLSKKVPLPFGVRNISTPRGMHHITSLEELEDGKSYICSHQRKIKPINLERASKKPLRWQSSRPISARRRAVQLSRQNEISPFLRSNTVVLGSTRNFVIFKNGDKDSKHNLVLDKKFTQSFDLVLDQVSEALQFPVFKLYNTDGRRILSTHALLLSSGTIVAAGREPFKPGNYDSDREFLPPKLPGISQRVLPKSRSKPIMKSPGKWKVSIFTSDFPAAGTTSQVYIMFYGHLRASTPIFLYSSQENAFQSGSEDTFDVNIGDVGEVFKIRIGHTNSGESPGWHCEEVQLFNAFSNEQFCIKVKHWLSQEEDDGEICRELPVLTHGQIMLPVTRYKIQLVTGNLWNAGTEANVYISLHGQYGDTGSRQLLRSNKPISFVKGQTDTFYVEAVHLGKLHMVIIGHDGLEPGNGWYLEKIIIYDGLKDKEYSVLCYRWLDEGEDDRKIVRRLAVSDDSDLPGSHELELRRQEMWNTERWKYQNENSVQFYCKTTKKFIRLTPDGRVDALGDKKDKYGLFEVLLKRGKVRVFRSQRIRNLALAVDKGIARAMDSSGVLCELLVHNQLNGSVILESTRMPGMTICFNSDGEPADDGITRYADVSKELVVHVKGIFHSGTVILLSTSWSQALSLRADGSCSGAGKQNVESYWRVHKIAPEVCMFESVTWPRMFLRIKSGECDGEGTGDDYCHFKVEKNYEHGSVTLESVRTKGIYVGLLPSGLAKPMIHTGEKNVVFYPQVIKFGREKLSGTSAVLYKNNEDISKQDEVVVGTQGNMDPSPSVSPLEHRNKRKGEEGPADASNAWKVSVLTGSTGTSANVTLWVCGSKGSTGPISLGTGKSGKLFKARQEDEFMVEIENVGKIYKIRIGHDGTGDNPEWKLERITLKQMRSGETYQFEANRWLSRKHGNCELVCEIPVVKNGAHVFPVVNYEIKVFTGHLEQAGTKADVYICLYGTRGDSGKRLLYKTDLSSAFQQGQVDAFEIEAVSLGKLQSLCLGCETNHKSQYWYCEKVIIREQGDISEYIFNCERWLPFMSQGTLHSKIELKVQEMEMEALSKTWQPSEIPEEAEPNNVVSPEGHSSLEPPSDSVPDLEVRKDQFGAEQLKYPTLTRAGENVKMIDGNLVEPDTRLSYPYMAVKHDLLYQVVKMGEDLVKQLVVPKAYRRIVLYLAHDYATRYPEAIPLRNASSKAIAKELVHVFSRVGIPKEILTDQGTPFMSRVMKELCKLFQVKQLHGEWKVTVVTGSSPNAGTDASVFLYVYGEGANSGPILLGSGSHQLFNVNSVDTFQVNLKHLEKIFKIRIGHDNSGDSPEWYLEEITLQNLSCDLEFCIPVNRWLGEEQDDGDIWRELCLTKDEKDRLPLLDYEIHIYTGVVSDVNLKMNVYLNIFGTIGDSGKRRLHRSKSEGALFQRGNVDVFCLQAISLGELQKILICQDGTKDGKGWFLDKVAVQYCQDGEDHLVVFPCNRWLDENREDGKTERILFASERENPKEDIEGKTWTIHIRTATDSSDTDALTVLFIFYGSNGKTKELSLVPQEPESRCFLPSSEDQFFVKIQDVGDIYKMRLVCENLPITPGWHLESVFISDPQTLQEIHFDCDCWLAADMEKEEVVKEFRVKNNVQELLPVNQYIVAVHTGDRWGAETSANVYITLYGERGDTGARKLYKSLIPEETFSRNKTDYFMLEAVSLGQLRKAVVGHDREGYGAGMYLKMVTVKESQDSLTEWVFPLWNWLDSHLGLQETVCNLHTIGKRLAVAPKHVSDSGGLWIIDIAGSGSESSDSLNYFSIWFYGNSDKEQVEIAISGDTLQIQKDLQQVGIICKVHVTWSPTQVIKPWYLSSIHLMHTVTLQEMWLQFNCWIRPNEDGCVELPALFPEKDPPPVVEYAVTVHTGNLEDGGSSGKVYIYMNGEHGDSGKRVLHSSGTDLLSFSKGQVDIFKIKAVYLGDIQQIVLGFSNSKSDSWFLEKITVKEDYTSTKYTFHYNDWITCQTSGEFTEITILLKDSVKEMIEIKSFDPSTQGKWQLQVLGDTAVKDEDLDLSVILYGKTGKSPIHNVKNVHYDPFLVNVGEIGYIIKATFLSKAVSSEKSLLLQILAIDIISVFVKIRMKDVDTKQEISFSPNEVCFPDLDSSESVVEVAAVHPDSAPLTEVTYSVYIKTGHFPAAGTSADVFITISGENGDSCKRILRHSSFPIFGKGKVDVFKIKTFDLGILSSVYIEHNGVGYGAGWYLDQITIHASDKADIKYLFPCQRWLDTAINDKQTHCDLKLLGIFNKTNQKLLPSSEGAASVIVETGNIPNTGTNSTVLLTICCEKGSYKPLVFAKGTLTHSCPSQKIVELTSSLGDIRKIRLQMEEDGNSSSWYCRTVKIEHQQSGDIMEFPFLRIFSSKSNQLYAELSALNPLGLILQVKSYDLHIIASQIPKPVSDVVLFITLRGTLGDTGRRKYVCKKKDLSSKEKMVKFQLETVDIGVIQEMVLETEKQTNLQLKHAVIEEGSFIKNKYIFIARSWKKEKNKMMSMALPVTEFNEADSSGLLLNENQGTESHGEWKMYLSARHNENLITDTLDYNLQIVIIFYGDKGKSNPIRLETEASSKNTNILAYKVNLTHDLGELFKVRLGLENWQEDQGRLSLYHLKMQNARTLDTFNQSINKTLPLSLSGDRWIEVPVEWPLKASLSAVSYRVTLYCNSLPEQKDKLNIGICLHGKHGDTGHRYLKWQSTQAENEDGSFTAALEAVELGKVHQADISMSSREGCKLHIKRIHVQESSKRELYVFDVNEIPDTELKPQHMITGGQLQGFPQGNQMLYEHESIEIQENLLFAIHMEFSVEDNNTEMRKDLLVSQVVYEEPSEAAHDTSFASNQMGSAEGKLVEHEIKVYTGDMSGAGTDANVYIILFGENGNSFGPVQLTQPLKDEKPFKSGKVDTFIISTKEIGTISHIEIGHNGTGFGSGWFLDKIEITSLSTNDMTEFKCNRWLADDEDDGQTVIQLYP